MPHPPLLAATVATLLAMPASHGGVAAGSDVEVAVGRPPVLAGGTRVPEPAGLPLTLTGLAFLALAVRRAAIPAAADDR
jgi:hypothetical protein